MGYRAGGPYRDRRVSLSSSRKSQTQAHWATRSVTHGRIKLMSRFKVLALATALALGSLSLATEASARGGHGGGHGGGGHWGGGHFGGHFGSFGFRRGFGWGPYY